MAPTLLAVIHIHHKVCCQKCCFLANKPL